MNEELNKIQPITEIDVLLEQNKTLKQMLQVLNDISAKSDKSLVALKKVLDRTEGML